MMYKLKLVGTSVCSEQNDFVLLSSYNGFNGLYAMVILLMNYTNNKYSFSVKR